jgi:hypothetical protein
VGLLAGLIFASEIFGPILIAKGLVEGVTGQDVVSGEPLDWKQRALGLLPVVGAWAEEGATALRVADEAGTELRVGTEGSGPWAEGVETEAGGAVAQTRPGSCVSACGEMLSNGALTEE